MDELQKTLFLLVYEAKEFKGFGYNHGIGNHHDQKIGRYFESLLTKIFMYYRFEVKSN